MPELLCHKNLQTTIKELNAKFGMKLKFITTRENAITQIVDTIGNATEEQQGMISPEAVDIYNALLAVPPTVEEVALSNPSPSGEEDMCQAYGVLYEGTDPECQACDQAEDCQEKTMQAAAAKSVAKEKKVKEVKEKKEKAPKVEVAKSRYGHKVGTQGQIMDDLFWEGSTEDQIVEALVEAKVAIDDIMAKKALKRHMAWLKAKKDVPVTKSVDGTYKTEIESI
jgi:hypothetical protein